MEKPTNHGGPKFFRSAVRKESCQVEETGIEPGSTTKEMSLNSPVQHVSQWFPSNLLYALVSTFKHRSDTFSLIFHSYELRQKQFS